MLFTSVMPVNAAGKQTHFHSSFHHQLTQTQSADFSVAKTRLLFSIVYVNLAYSHFPNETKTGRVSDHAEQRSDEHSPSPGYK